MPTLALLDSSSFGIESAIDSVDDDADGEDDVINVDEGDTAVDVGLASVVDGAAAVMAALNCHPLNGMPTTAVAAVAVADVFSQPESPPKSLAKLKTWPSSIVDMHWLAGATIEIEAFGSKV
jgi:hypothetical protein